MLETPHVLGLRWICDVVVLEAISRNASSHLCIAMCERSMTEPTRAVNFSRHLLTRSSNK
jgi:hypothetical protein